MNLGAYVDLYCERTAPGLFNEPANLLSNLGFLIAGAWLLRQLWRRQPRPPGVFFALAWLIVAIGLGSATFHAMATAGSEILDVAFIGIFIYLFVASFLRHAADWPWRYAWLGIPGFFVFGWLVQKPFAAGAFNGSVDYFPAAAGLALMTVFLAWHRLPAWRGFAGATLAFLVSLWLRSEDQAWCASFPLGVHWAWHLLNAITLYLVAASLARHATRSVGTRDRPPWPVE